ncbi:CtsR family transcriptional regulator [Streptococcus ferus]|uniref:Transcriptional regulator CtsR n=1 Tax=Streptococcus ferus TaxID=1345 RepID=A0A2X3WB86_9STRE|nr:CtsR family transcriptional regulator [Streptococcus ferus]SQF41193.1 transcriptional repressor CtsR [Streptococcus ferus]
MPKNTSDSIEEYIKQILAESGFAEIKRSVLADSFSVVPSQINYVIKTRFTPSRGYEVESKRGGGGYIRIAKVRFSDKHQMLNNLEASIGSRISEQFFGDIIQNLFDEGVLTQREGNIILVASSDQVLGLEAPQIRARMLRKLLQRLDRKG